MTRQNIMDLPVDYSLVLQLVNENGEKEFTELTEILCVTKPRMEHILRALQGKGLIRVGRTMYSGVWIKLSAKGQKLTSYIWPDAIRAS